MMAVPLAGHAQLNEISEMIKEAGEYVKQGEYQKAIETNGQIIDLLKANGVEQLVPTITDNIALCHLYLGIPLLKAKKYADAEEHFDWAAEHSKPDGKVNRMARLYQADNLSAQSLDIRADEGDYAKALVLSQQAAKIYESVDTVRMLRQTLTSADICIRLNRTGEAMEMLRKVEAACAENPTRALLLGRAYTKMGEIEMNVEEFSTAPSHLQRGYELCEQAYNNGEAAAKPHMMIAAQMLVRLYGNSLMDVQKAQYWEEKAAALGGK